MKFPLVTRRKYEALWRFAKTLSEQVSQLEAEKQNVVNHVIEEKHRFEDWKTIERSGFETIYNNLRSELERLEKVA
jgi:hypothetical protein